MDCTWIARDEVFEQYVRDALEPDDRDAFEEHYFGCAACFDKIRTYQALRVELPANLVELPATSQVRTRTWRWAVVPAAAVVLLMVAVAFLMKPAPSGAPRLTAALTLPAEVPVAVSAPETAPRPLDLSTPEPRRQPAVPPVVALSVLARVDPPVYLPAALRGPRSDAAEKFQAAMLHYADGGYAGAIPELREAARLKPDAAQYAFFLAICQLLTAQVDAAISGLRQTVALGESPYLEEAHFYLAKARLRQGDIRAARAELQRTIERRGRLEEAARSLLVQIDVLPEREDRPPGK